MQGINSRKPNGKHNNNNKGGGETSSLLLGIIKWKEIID
ncbi:hypothetical protein HMPREF1252_0581 [Peptoniphilus sp. BV3AC2]|nr:hypothetical protein HMPREF1252_0581 [Peptoniphilus sp. BV3AC2]